MASAQVPPHMAARSVCPANFVSRCCALTSRPANPAPPRSAATNTASICTRLISSSLLDCFLPSEPVQCSCIVAENLLLHLGRHVGPPPEDIDGVHVARGVGMAVIGADDETVLAARVDDVAQVVGVLTGDEHAALAHAALGPLSPQRLETVLPFMDHPGQPLRAGFDEAEAEPGKGLRHVAQEHVAEGGHGRDAKLVKGGGGG